MDSRIYWIWLAQALGPGSTAVGDLLDAFGHAAAVYDASSAQLRAAGFSTAVRQRLNDRSLDEARVVLDRVLEAGDWVLTPQDALYPAGLQCLRDRPAVLYCRGNLPDFRVHPAVTVVGTRHPSQEGVREAYALASGLAAAGMTVVSGGAVGIDAAVHAGALAGGGITLLVMACPLEENYPKDNAALRRQIVDNGGALMSEYPPGLPYKCLFPVRNRLLAGLSLGVCLAETPVRSGARITARLARENGRDVFALPGALAGHHNDGAHREIRGGATLVTRAVDIVEEYAPQFPGVLEPSAAVQTWLEDTQPAAPQSHPSSRQKREKPPAVPRPVSAVPVPLPSGASADAEKVYHALTETPQPVDVLADRSGLPVPVLLAALTELEMLGCAVNSAGQQYRRA